MPLHLVILTVRGMCLDAKLLHNISGVILPFDVVCAGSPSIIILQKVNKQVEENIGILR